MIGAVAMDPAWLRPIASIGVLALLIAWESAAPYFTFFRGHARSRLAHAGRNLLFGLLNLLLASVGFALVWAWAAGWSEARRFGLLHHFPLPTAARFLTAILLLDLWTYGWHWANHRIPFFWRFHRMHHSDPTMDVTTANRFHPGEILFSSLLRILLIPLLGIRLPELLAYETALFAVVQFHHANIALPAPADRFLRWIIPTPAMHKIHHSRLVHETNSNYSSLFSIWDHLFQTFQIRNPRLIRFGLDEFDAAKFQSVRGLAATPWVHIPAARAVPPGGRVLKD